MSKLGNRYLDGGVPTSGYLAGALDELTNTGLLALADPQFPTTKTRTRTRLSGPEPLATSGPDPRGTP